mmetsp:Transcript_129207/g.182164  ORF Transcript_129207/g.182164 Transcript_129207/m.182164 type:complete len:279 (-) Transcript_129207:1840-2676(-)
MDSHSSSLWDTTTVVDHESQFIVSGEAGNKIDLAHVASPQTIRCASRTRSCGETGLEGDLTTLARHKTVRDVIVHDRDGAIEVHETTRDGDGTGNRIRTIDAITTTGDSLLCTHVSDCRGLDDIVGVLNVEVGLSIPGHHCIEGSGGINHLSGKELLIFLEEARLADGALSIDGASGARGSRDRQRPGLFGEARDVWWGEDSARGVHGVEVDRVFIASQHPVGLDNLTSSLFRVQRSWNLEVVVLKASVEVLVVDGGSTVENCWDGRRAVGSAERTGG